MTEKVGNPDKGWPLIVAFVSLIGFLYATVPPQLIDPILKSHVRFPDRVYEHNWMTVPLGVFVLIATWWLAKRKVSVIVLAAPVWIAALIANYVIFEQEFPHGHTTFIAAVWSGIMGAWVWIRNSCDDALDKLEAAIKNGLENDLLLEYVKGYISFFRALAFGLGTGFFGLVVSAIATGLEVGHGIVTSKADIHVLIVLNGITYSVFGLFLIFGPIHEALRSWLKLAQQLLVRSSRPDRKRE